MNLIQAALRKPVSILVSVLAIVFFSVMAIRNMRIDIFPKTGLPTIYVAQPYGGLSPEQMEGFITSYYEYHFLYVTGVKFVESKSVQGAALIKIVFQEGTDMSQAMGEVVGYVNRSRAFMPPGTVPPFVTRFDAGSVPVGQLVFRSETRSLSEIQDLALFKVRPMFSTLPGVSAPPPFGGNQKTVIIRVNPEKIRDYHLSPDEVVQALAKSNTISPAGNLRVGDENWITQQNSVVDNIRELENVPVNTGNTPLVFVKDIGNVELGADVTTGYALINGKRSVYIPVTKRADAATWDVVQRVKKALSDMQAAVPEDIKVSYEFDQSGYVIHALQSLLWEGGLGALLTGLMVLLFLGDSRSALIVVLTIPLALLSAMIVLFALGQTINIMTLGGLALAIGILVDEATVTIENIHTQLQTGKTKARAILDACREIAAPKFLILLCILAVFVPALFMTGMPGSLFRPLSMAVGLAMIASFLLSQTFVPVLASRLLKKTNHDGHKRFNAFRDQYLQRLSAGKNRYGITSLLFILITLTAAVLLLMRSGKDIFPKAETGQIVVRLRMPAGTRLERTETAVQRLLQLTDSITQHQVAISSAFAGTQPASYPVNLIHLWTSGPQEALIRINLNQNSGWKTEDLKEKIRVQLPSILPQAKISFEPGDLTEQVLNMGSSNPVEIAIQGRNLAQSRGIAKQLVQQLQTLPELRDVQLATVLDYPGIQLDIDRVKAGTVGITTEQIGKSTVTATSSSRFTQPNYWLDKSTGTAYQLQVEYPQYRMNAPEQLEQVPVSGNNGNTVLLRNVAAWKKISVPGEYNRLNQQRFLTVTANLHQSDLASALEKVNQKIAGLGELPKGMKIMLRGQPELLAQTTSELSNGLLIAIVVIVLLLAVYFQSFRMAMLLLLLLPAVITGALLLLWLAGQSLNIQSYTGIIMAVGVSVANAVLFVTRAEYYRKQGTADAHLPAAKERIRPILMTALAMIAGMIPMALGVSGSGEAAPLGIAVIGGLLFSTISILYILPGLYAFFNGNRPARPVSLDPSDINSLYYDEQA
jgi:multidrug efflux pump subunit AcrB